jgi:outer membrane immunogenic protein
MRKLIIAGIAATGFIAAPTLAEAQTYTWSGFYVGGSAGYGRANHDVNIFTIVHDEFNPRSAIWGAYTGYNFQAGPAIVGIEGDWNWTNFHAQDPIFTTETKLNSLGSIRARIGFPYNQMMFYTAVGWGWGNEQIRRPAVPTNTNVSETEGGFSAAVGVEYAFAQNWIGRFQYDFYNFSAEHHPQGALSNAADSISKTRLQTVRIGLAYKFNTGR